MRCQDGLLNSAKAGKYHQGGNRKQANYPCHCGILSQLENYRELNPPRALRSWGLLVGNAAVAITHGGALSNSIPTLASKSLETPGRPQD